MSKYTLITQTSEYAKKTWTSGSLDTVNVLHAICIYNLKLFLAKKILPEKVKKQEISSIIPEESKTVQPETNDIDTSNNDELGVSIMYLLNGLLII